MSISNEVGQTADTLVYWLVARSSNFFALDVSPRPLFPVVRTVGYNFGLSLGYLKQINETSAF